MNNTNIDQTLSEFNDAFKALLEQAHRPVAQEITQFIEFRAKDGGANNGKGILWFGERLLIPLTPFIFLKIGRSHHYTVF